ncbi:hypothetical protein ACWIVY_09780 [Ursidibacter sp. B-7004-1]
MKVAVCMYGLMRTFEKTASSLKKHVLEPNKADLYVFSPQKIGKSIIPNNIDINLYKSQNKSEISNMDCDGEIITEEKLRMTYGSYLKGFELYEPEPNLFNLNIDIAMNDILVPSRVMSLFYNMSNAVKLALNSDTEYDIIILLRPDLAYYSEIDVTNILEDGIHIPLGGGKLNDGKQAMPLYYVGYYKNMEKGELIQAHKHVFTDQIMVFKKDCYQSISVLFDNVTEYLKNGVPFHPETILYYALVYLNNKNVYLHEEWLYEIVRNNTEIIENDDILIQRSKYSSRLDSEGNVRKKLIEENNHLIHSNNRYLEFKLRVKRKIKSAVKRLI